MSHLANENAALKAEVSALRGELCIARADLGHVTAKLRIMSERQWAGDRRGIQALVAGGRPREDMTGFAPGSWI